MWRKKSSMASSTHAISLPRSARLPALDLRTIVIRHDAAAFDPAAQTHVLQFRILFAEIDDDEIVGNAIQGITVTARRFAAAAQQRFVVARDETFIARAVAAHAKGREVRFEESPRHLCRGICESRGSSTHVAPRLFRAHGRTAGREARPDFGDIVFRPAGQLVPPGGTKHGGEAALKAGAGFAEGGAGVGVGGALGGGGAATLGEEAGGATGSRGLLGGRTAYDRCSRQRLGGRGWRRTARRATGQHECGADQRCRPSRTEMKTRGTSTQPACEFAGCALIEPEPDRTYMNRV